MGLLHRFFICLRKWHSSLGYVAFFSCASSFLTNTDSIYYFTLKGIRLPSVIAQDTWISSNHDIHSSKYLKNKENEICIKCTMRLLLLDEFLIGICSTKIFFLFFSSFGSIFVLEIGHIGFSLFSTYPIDIIQHQKR